MFSPDQVPTQIEQVADSRMRAEESLSLSDRLELTHSPFPYPGRLMRLLSPIILILLGIVNRLWNKLSMSYSIAKQLVSYDLSGFAAMVPQ